MRRNYLRLGTDTLLHIWSGVLDECTRSSGVRNKHQCTTGTGEWAMGILYYDLCRDRPHHDNIHIQLLLRCHKRSSCFTIATLLRRITEREPMWYNMLRCWTILCGQRVLRSEQCTGRIQQQRLHCAGGHSNEHGIHSTDQ